MRLVPVVTGLLLAACQQPPPATLSAESRIQSSDEWERYFVDCGERVILQLVLTNVTDSPIEYLGRDAAHPWVHFGWNPLMQAPEIPSEWREPGAIICGTLLQLPPWHVLAPGGSFSFRVVADPRNGPLRIGMCGMRSQAAAGSTKEWDVECGPIALEALPLVVEVDELEIGSRYSTLPQAVLEDSYGSSLGVEFRCLGEVAAPPDAKPGESFLAFEITNPSMRPIHILASSRRPWLDWEEWDPDFGAWGFHRSTRCLNCLEAYREHVIQPGGSFRWQEESHWNGQTRYVLDVSARDEQEQLHTWQVRSGPEPARFACFTWGDSD